MALTLALEMQSFSRMEWDQSINECAKNKLRAEALSGSHKVNVWGPPPSPFHFPENVRGGPRAFTLFESIIIDGRNASYADDSGRYSLHYSN